PLGDVGRVVPEAPDDRVGEPLPGELGAIEGHLVVPGRDRGRVVLPTDADLEPLAVDRPAVAREEEVARGKLGDVEREAVRVHPVGDLAVLLVGVDPDLQGVLRGLLGCAAAHDVVSFSGWWMTEEARSPGLKSRMIVPRGRWTNSTGPMMTYSTRELSARRRDRKST